MDGSLPDTLVLDCEGAFIPIVISFPDILNSVKTVIMENDYSWKIDYDKVATILGERHFSRVFVQALDSDVACKPNFFKVWKRHDVAS